MLEGFDKILKNRHYFFPIIIILITLYGCNRTKERESASVQISDIDQIQIESLKQKATTTSADSAILCYQSIKKIAKNKKYDQVLFDAYCKTALIYIQRKDEFEFAKQQLDSAAALPVASSNKTNEAALNLKYGIIYQSTDTALSFFKKAIQQEKFLSEEDKRSVHGALAKYYLINKSYVFAEQSALQFLALSKNIETVSNYKDQIVTYNNLYLIKVGMGDTLAGFAYLNKALQLNNQHFPNDLNIFVCQNLGKYYLNKQQLDSSRYFFRKLNIRLKRDYCKDYQFYSYTYFAEVELADNHYTQSMLLLDTAATFLAPDEVKDPFIQREFYTTKYEIEKTRKNSAAALAALESANTYGAQINNNNPDQQLIFLQNQLRELESEQKLDRNREQLKQQSLSSWLLSFALITLLTMAILTALYWRKKKQLESQRLIQAQQKSAIEKASLTIEIESRERKRIAKEIHDEIGSSITSISLAVNSLKQNPNLSNTKPLEILERNSKSLTQQAKEIVWSLNESNDSLTNLVAYLYHHAHQFTQDNGFKLKYHATEPIPDIVLEGIKRRFIFQTVKEIMNNSVKYSGGDLISLSIDVEGDTLNIVVSDNGSGLLPTPINHFGNGLKNIKTNIYSIGGTIENITRDGLCYRIRVPLKTNI